MEYMSVIVDECNTVQYYSKDLTSQEEMEILEEHPEWYTTCICV